MKRWLIIMLLAGGVAMLLTPAAGGSTRVSDFNWNSIRLLQQNGDLHNWASWIEGAVTGGATVGTGDFFYVDSNVSATGSGTSWDQAKTTVAAAVALCTANNGDVVLVAQGHAENLSSATALKITTAGVTVIGAGTGSLRPTFTTSATAGLVHLNAANVLFVNCNIVCGIDNTTTLAKIQGDYSGFIGCSFYEGGPDGDMNGVTAITVGVADNDSDHFIIAGCDLYLPTTTRWTEGVTLDKDMKGGRILNTRIYGDFSEACIDIPAGGNAQVDLLVEGCVLTNTETGDHALQANGTANRGVVRGCTFVTNGTYVDAGGLRVTDNVEEAYGTDSDAVGQFQMVYIEKAAVAVTGGSVADVFTVAGGDILVHYLAFTFTTAASANACTMAFEWDPTAGAGTNTAIASGIDVQSVAIGSTVWVEGDASAAAIAALGTDVPRAALDGGFIVGPGGIDVVMGSSDLTTGIGTVKMIYTKLSSGVTVAAP